MWPDRLDHPTTRANQGFKKSPQEKTGPNGHLKRRNWRRNWRKCWRERFPRSSSVGGTVHVHVPRTLSCLRSRPVGPSCFHAGQRNEGGREGGVDPSARLGPLLLCSVSPLSLRRPSSPSDLLGRASVRSIDPSPSASASARALSIQIRSPGRLARPSIRCAGRAI